MFPNSYAISLSISIATVSKLPYYAIVRPMDNYSRVHMMKLPSRRLCNVTLSEFHYYRAMHYSAKLQSAVLRSHVVCLSVCNVGGSGAHRLAILEINCTDN